MEGKMKKIIALMLTTVMCTAFAGCSSLTNALSSSNNDGTDSSTGYAEDGYAEGRMGDTMHTDFFDYTVNSAYLCDEYNGYVPSADGYELLVAELTIKNTDNETIPMFDTDFQIQWGDDADDAYDVPVTYWIDSSVSLGEDVLPGEYDLAVDEERTGLLVFEVPEGHKDFSISYLVAFDNDTTGDVFFVYFSAEKK